MSNISARQMQSGESCCPLQDDAYQTAYMCTVSRPIGLSWGRRYYVLAFRDAVAEHSGMEGRSRDRTAGTTGTMQGGRSAALSGKERGTHMLEIQEAMVPLKDSVGLFSLVSVTFPYFLP